MILLLVLLVFSVILGILYQHFRADMSRFTKEAAGEIEKYNYSVLLRFFLLYSIICISPMLAILAFISVYSLPWVESFVQFLLIVLGIIIISFASATYYTSITIEQFVMKPIKESDYYKPLRIAIKFFHGPISHIGQYLGFNLLLMSLSMYSYFDVKDFSLHELVLAGSLGISLGGLIGYAQHLNRTWKYQLWAFAFVASLFITLIAFQLIDLRNEFTVIYLFYLIVALSFLFIKNIRAFRYKERNIYSQEYWWI